MLQDLLSTFLSPAEKQGYLLQLTAAHPYFAPAQFCLLQTMQPGEAEYGHRAAIAHLLYNNAHWLQFQLAQTGKPKMAAPPIPTAEAAVLMDTAAAPTAEETMVVDAPTATTALPELTVEAPAAEETEAAHTEMDKTELTEAAVLMDTSATPTAEETVVVDAPTITTALPELPVEAPAAEEMEAAHTEVDNTELTEKTAEPLAEEAILEDKGAIVAETAASDMSEPTEEEIPNPLGAPANPPAPLPAPEKEEMLFEPLFAVDYFASQGIKLSEEVQSSDKLGKQLKSFTEWLKSMKKTYTPSPADEELAEEEEVQTIAEKSNTEGDVVTEAMAEVFALQGRKQKAAAIYRKLSLLNPHKSAYFAAKIENLK